MSTSIGAVFLDKSEPWVWDGKKRWWIIESKVTGYNGSGGYWIERTWRWNGSSQIIRKEILTLSPTETDQLELLPRA